MATHWYDYARMLPFVQCPALLGCRERRVLVFRYPLSDGWWVGLLVPAGVGFVVVTLVSCAAATVPGLTRVHQ